MRVEFANDVQAHLNAVSKTRFYRQGYLTPPDDPIGAIRDIALGLIPVNWGPCDPPMVVIDSEDWLRHCFDERTLPHVMVVAEFVAYRPKEDGLVAYSIRRFVWLQDEIGEDLSQGALQLLRRVEWRDGAEST